jgi:Integral membrane protein (PIN domain superfamily)
MFEIFHRKQRLWQLIKENNDLIAISSMSDEPTVIGEKLAFNLATIAEQLGGSPDVIIREFSMGPKKEAINGAIVFIDGLVDKNQIERDILTPLMVETQKVGLPNPGDLLASIQTKILPVGEIKTKTSARDIVDAVLSGSTALLIDGIGEALLLSTIGWEKRAIQEPTSEVVVRGPREGFTETLRTNTALLRRKIRNSNLIFEVMRIGEQTKTDVCIAYIKGIADDNLIMEIKRRLKRIKTDSILESGYIEEFIEDAPFSLFATIARSERPDAVAGKILEGRAAILVAGTPFVLTVPMLFVEIFQSPEDYYARAYYSTLVRWLRYIAFGISLLMPAVYVALTSFHSEIIPPPLLITLTAAREGLPFPVVFEALGMGLLFEILREAGIRLPRSIGQTISIVGALVIGQAVVSAGLVGAPMVIVVASTAIASFVVPVLSDLTAFLRIALTILAGMFGAYGIMIGLLTLLIHLATLRSFGTPYLSPVVPFFGSDFKDVAIRSPWWAMFLRPHNFGWDNSERQDFSLRPAPPSPKSGDDDNKS